MAERWVLNASPLIVLINAGQEDLIRQLAEETIVPQAVADESVISSASVVLQSVRRIGFRLDEQLIRAALMELGESWP